MADSTCCAAQVLFGAKDLRMIQKPVAHPSRGEVQIAVKSTTLCGSDLHYFHHYANGDMKVREPLTQGHEAAGIVVAVGPDVSEVKIGDRVAIEAGVPCETCVHCMDGRYNVCPRIKFRSSAASYPHFQGTLQEKINHPARWCHRLPDGISFDEGALLEPLSVAIHAARKATIGGQTRCLVIGAGAVGLFCAAVAKRKGCQHVMMTDIALSRLQFAHQNGFADETFATEPRSSSGIPTEDLSNAKSIASELLESGDELTRAQGGFGVVFECTGVESCVRLAIYATSPGGSVLLVGMGTPIQTLHLSAATSREIDLKGVWRYANTYPEALEMMQHSSIDPGAPKLSKIITHTFQGLEFVPVAFATAGRAMDDSGNLVVKVVVQN